MTPIRLTAYPIEDRIYSVEDQETGKLGEVGESFHGANVCSELAIISEGNKIRK